VRIASEFPIIAYSAMVREVEKLIRPCDW